MSAPAVRGVDGGGDVDEGVANHRKNGAVDVSWLEPDMEATIEFTWGTVTGVLVDHPNCHPRFLGFGRRDDSADSYLGVRSAWRDESFANVVRVVSPAPPVTQEDDQARGDLEVRFEIQALRSMQMRAYRVRTGRSHEEALAGWQRQYPRLEFILTAPLAAVGVPADQERNEQ